MGRRRRRGEGEGGGEGEVVSYLVSQFGAFFQSMRTYPSWIMKCWTDGCEEAPLFPTGEFVAVFVERRWEENRVCTYSKQRFFFHFMRGYLPA